MRNLCIVGIITSVKGLKGELKLTEKSAEYNYLEAGDNVYVEGVFETLNIEKIREVKNSLFIQLSGINTIERAKELVGKNLYIDESMKKQPEDDYYSEDLMNLEVYNENGEYLGEVVDVLDNSVQYILTIRKESKEWMLPFVDAFVKDIQIDNKKIIVEIIEGMIE